MEKPMMKKASPKFHGTMRSSSAHVQRENMRTLRQKHGMSEADAVRHAMRGMKKGMK